MEHTMASRPITYRADPDTSASHGLTAAIGHKLVAFASAFRAYGIWHDIRVLEDRARRHPGAAARPWSLSAWFGAAAARSARALASEVRIRRDRRQLMLMSDHMLKDIGLTRAQIDRAVRYGRD
jgi:uncharacterized protein YjiS (DUF1127 family)